MAFAADGKVADARIESVLISAAMESNALKTPDKTPRHRPGVAALPQAGELRRD